MISFETLVLVALLVIGLVVAAAGLMGGLAGSMSSAPAAGASAEKGGCAALIVGIVIVIAVSAKLWGLA
ncbi:MAG: hypothetical protein WCS75_11520 [Sphingomonas sp.]|jgi:hypothetical protein|uniref:hypothetical protein n=1 Tax=Sphingomonas sp. TaxID=28214 RepID=UPI003568F7F3